MINKPVLAKAIILGLSAVLFSVKSFSQSPRTVANFDKGWHFNLGEVANGETVAFDDSHWHKLNLPHDWSIEGEFKKENPATPEGGALPGGEFSGGTVFKLRHR